MSFRMRLAAIVILLLVPNIAYARSRQSFHDEMRRLWSDHVVYTRLFIVSNVGGLPDLGATTQRLLQNQQDIGDAVGDFYGSDAGDQLAALLTDHILIAANIVNAAKAGDSAEVDAQVALWYQNATDIADFLSAANPKYWTQAELEAALFTHLEQTIAEATHQIEGDYEESIEDFDEALDHMLTFADILSQGIIRQFPRKFNNGR